MTLTAYRAIRLLEIMGVSADDIRSLVRHARDIAVERHSSMLGYRHILQAAGVATCPPRPAALTRETSKLPDGAVGCPADGED